MFAPSVVLYTTFWWTIYTFCHMWTHDMVSAAYALATVFTQFSLMMVYFASYAWTGFIATQMIAYHMFSLLLILSSVQEWLGFVPHHVAAIMVSYRVIDRSISEDVAHNFLFTIDLSNIFMNIYLYARLRGMNHTADCMLSLVTATYIPMRTVVLWNRMYYMWLDNQNLYNLKSLKYIYVSVCLFSALYSYNVFTKWYKMYTR